MDIMMNFRTGYIEADTAILNGTLTVCYRVRYKASF